MVREKKKMKSAISDTLKVLSAIVLVLGVIGGFVFAFILSDMVYSGFFYGILYFVIIVLSSGITSAILYGLATVIELLESLNDRMYEISDSLDETNKSMDIVTGKGELLGEDEWKCPKCGRVNKNYVGTCVCGQSKY